MMSMGIRQSIEADKFEQDLSFFASRE